MGDSSALYLSNPSHAPSVYRLWQIARERGKSDWEREDIYRELLTEFGHRNVETAQWSSDSGFIKAKRTMGKPQT